MEKSIKSNCSFGYDLSAATDRLPIYLQERVLSSFFGEKLALAWVDLLVRREYILPTSEYSQGDRLHYAVGQPMGALSSWAMLAVTHHLLVQLAATMAGKRAYNSWYDNYELLGDDINIFDALVARQYLSLMEDIGVPINVSKSVVATNATFEFAKCTGHKGKMVGALSWKSLVSQNTLLGRVAVAYSLIRKGSVDNKIMSRLSQFFHKNRIEKGDDQYGFIALLTILANTKHFSIAELYKLFTPSSYRIFSYHSVLNGVSLETIRSIIGRVLKGPLSPEVLSKKESV